MADQWFVTRDGEKEYGPYSKAKLKDLAERGRISPSDQVRREDDDEWTPAEDVPWLALPASATEIVEEPRPKKRRPERDEEEDEDRPRVKKRRPDGRSKTLGPAIGLYVTGVLALGYGIFNIFAANAMNPNGPPIPPGADAGQRTGFMIGYYGSLYGLPLLPIPVLIGALCLQTCRAYPMAMIGCILACIPCCSPLIVLGIPFGIWGLVMLNDEDVKRAFS